MKYINLNKFIVPLSNRTIDRAKLLSLFEKSRQKKIVVVCAPAGYGKSTFLSDVVNRRESRFLWYQIDEEDTNVDNFRESLFCGLYKTINGQAPNEVGNIRELFAVLRETEEEMIFIFEDFHYLNGSTAVLKEFKKLMEISPANCRFIISSREKLKINLAKEKLSGNTCEIDSKALEFSQEEIQLLFRLKFSKALDTETSTLIYEKTEGWPVAVSLLLERVGQGDYSLFDGIDAADIIDYLTQEVFNNLPHDYRVFAMKSAFLEELDVDYLNELLDTNKSETIICNLTEKNIFIHSDISKKIFKYHKLFRSFLMQRAYVLLDEGELEDFFKKASKLYLRDNYLIKALNILQLRKAHEETVFLLEERAIELIKEKQILSVKHIMDKIPTEFKLESPWVTLIESYLLKLAGKWSDALVMIEKPAIFFERQNCELGKHEVEMLKTWILLDRGDLDEALLSLEEVLATIEDTGYSKKAEIFKRKAIIYWQKGELMKTEMFAYRALDCFYKTEDRLGIAAMYNNIAGFIHIPNGRYYEALEMHKKSLHLENSHNPKSDTAVMSMVNIGYTYTMIGQMGEAERYFIDAIEKAKENNFFRMLSYAYSKYAALCLETNRIDDAENFFLLASTIQEQLHELLRSAEIDYGLSYVYRARGNYELALKHAQLDRIACEKLGNKLLICQANINEGIIHWFLGNEKRASKYISNNAEFYINSIDKRASMPAQLYRCVVLMDECIEEFVDRMDRLIGEVVEEKLEYTLMKEKRLLSAVCRKLKELNFDIAKLEHFIKLMQLDEITDNIFVSLLGKFKLSVNGKEVCDNEWRRPKERVLFQYIAMKYPNKVSKDLLIEDLWSDKSIDDAKKNINTSLYNLRKLLNGKLESKEKVINSQKNSICFSDSFLIFSDVSQVKTLWEKASLARDNKDKILVYLLEMLGLFKGDLLPELICEEWTISEREYLRSIYYSALKTVAKRYLEQERYEASKYYLDKLILADETDESTHRMLMLLFYETGQRKKLIRQYNKCVQIIDVEFGVDVSKETRKVYAEMMDEY
ncbi:MAG: tetratricopeptide repeat protein [Clostridiales bacterium]|nr:tetratricopeptide repeat protein [Clostridiales bacterium]